MRGREGWGCTTWGIKGKDIYLLHVLRRRMEYPGPKRAVREQCQAFDASVVLVEDKASGTQLIQELVAEGLHAVTRSQLQSAGKHLQIVSSIATTSIEDTIAARGVPVWFQLSPTSGGKSVKPWSNGRNKPVVRLLW
jgi:hypothetical protein